MKTKGITKALLKKLEAATKLNEVVYVSVLMRSPVLNPAPGGGTWYPVIPTSADEITARLNEGYSFCFRDAKPVPPEPNDRKVLRTDV
jgi:hypothetical protein